MFLGSVSNDWRTRDLEYSLEKSLNDHKQLISKPTDTQVTQSLYAKDPPACRSHYGGAGRSNPGTCGCCCHRWGITNSSQCLQTTAPSLIWYTRPSLKKCVDLSSTWGTPVSGPSKQTVPINPSKPLAWKRLKRSTFVDDFVEEPAAALLLSIGCIKLLEVCSQLL